MHGQGIDIVVRSNPLLKDCGIPESGDLSDLSPQQLKEIINNLCIRFIRFGDFDIGACHIGEVMAKEFKCKSLLVSTETSYVIWAMEVAQTISLLAKERVSLKEQFEKVKAEKAAVEEALGSYKKQHKEISCKMSELQAELAAAKLLITESHQVKGQLNDINRAKDQAKEGLCKAKIDISKLKTLLHEAEARHQVEIAKLTDQIKALQAKHQEQLAKFMTETKDLRTHLGVLSSSSKEDLGSEMKQLQTTVKAITEKFKAQFLPFQAKIAELTALNQSLKTENQSQAAELSQQQAGLVSKNDEIARLNANIREVIAQLEAMQRAAAAPTRQQTYPMPSMAMPYPVMLPSMPRPGAVCLVSAPPAPGCPVYFVPQTPFNQALVMGAGPITYPYIISHRP
ncbi:MAG: hypothetical protein K0S29_727 [Gammaproteobacteria bacterium]|jgi:hypothetical protein|nr:hypothetical protein [Gammaproteobacteria bacterium]